jgi:hypothetical protein
LTALSQFDSRRSRAYVHVPGLFGARTLASVPRGRRPIAFPIILHGPGALGLSGPLPQGAQNIAQIAAAGAAATGMIIGVLAAIPVAGPIAAAIAGIGVAIANLFGGCGQTCVRATQIANQVEEYLQQNLSAYMSAPVRYQSLQLAALNNVDTAMVAMRQACGDPGLGPAGQRCISERLVKGGPAPWCPNPGGVGCDWITLYRDPIAKDSAVVADPSATSAAGGGSLLRSVGIDPSSTVGGVKIADLLLPAALILGALLIPSQE